MVRYFILLGDAVKMCVKLMIVLVVVDWWALVYSLKEELPQP